MSKSEKQKADGGRQKADGARQRAVFCCLLLSAFCLLLSGCRQDMQDQPRYEPYESSTFFKDGLSSRAPVAGTVPRGYLRADKQLFTGQNGRTQGNTNNQAQGGVAATGNANAQSNGGMTAPTGNAGAQTVATEQANAQANSAQPVGDANDTADFPFPVTQEVMERGKERFEIFCAMCHGLTGEGDGMIVRRGYRQPPSYHEERLRQARVGYFFRVMTEGYGAMPSYSSQVPVQDRWAIAAYIRALQLSHLNQTQGAPPASAAHRTSTEEGGGHE